MLDKIEIRYNQYEQCHKVISTPESIGELKDWGTKPFSSCPFYLHDADTASLEAWVLPKHGTRIMPPVIDQVIQHLDSERAYRQAVIAQHTAAEKAVKWHTDTLPVRNPHPYFNPFDS
jgi:hypothetical protein